MVIEVPAILKVITGFLIRSVVSPLGAIENLWKNAPLRINPYNSVVYALSYQVKNIKANCKCVQNAEYVIEMLQTIGPSGHIYGQNCNLFRFWGP